ncbi:MAG TPA: lipid II flippase MurJ [Ktedonobacteraceae bacterium]|nr:lipid II flippase MurJ [Ktedonobacteraceae bacterium]
MSKESIEDQSESIEKTNEVASIPRVSGGLIEQNELAIPLEEEVTGGAVTSERRQIAKSASLVMLGNLGSSLLGMVRQIVVTAIGTNIAGPFNAALLPARTFNDLLINGSVSGALIPTFNDYSAPEKRDELRRVIFTLVNLILVVMLIAAVGYLFIAPHFINVLVTGFQGSDKQLTLLYSQIIFFSLLALGPFAVLLAALFALKEFGWPAFATGAYHVGIILGAGVGSLLGARYFGHLGLAVGVLFGAAGEIVLLLPGIRKQQLYYMFVLDLKHPALRRIARLYGPVAFSFLVTMGLVFLDQHLASLTHDNGSNGPANTTALSAATTLIQFPVGLVAAALSFAVLPTLSEHARNGDIERFKQTLLLGFRVGLLLMIPAMVGLIVLRTPIVDLLFRHHNYTGEDAARTALALQNYAYQLPFVALDQLLIAAFYARKNTLTPVAVGVICIAGYLVVALPFYNSIGMPALAFANTVQNSLHAIILLILLRMAIGTIRVRETIPTILKILLAAAAMFVVAWGLLLLLGHIGLFSLSHLLGDLLTVAVAGGIASMIYIGGILLLRVEEVGLVRNAVMAKLGKR